MDTKNNISLMQGFSKEAGYGSPIITSGYSVNNKRYLPYSSDSKRYNTTNTYPQMISKLLNESPTHAAAINLKSMLTKGMGFDKEVLPKQITKKLNRINSKNQTIDDILEQVAADYVTFGGFALKVKWSQGGKIESIYRIHFTDVRCGEPDEQGDVNYYVINNNWDLTQPTRLAKCYSLPVFNASPFVTDEGVVKDVVFEQGVIKLTEEQTANGEQIIYFYKETNSPSSSGMYYYPVPDYIAGIDCILQEADINTSNKSLINNGLGGKIIVNVPFNEINDDKRRAFHQNLVKNFTGAENNGGTMVNFSADVDSFPTFQVLPTLDADSYINIKASVLQSIVTSHNIPSILLNLKNGNSWSSSKDELEQALFIFNKTKIASYQNDITRVFNTILGFMGYDIELKIIPFQLDYNVIEIAETTIVVSNDNKKTSLDSK